MAEELHSDKFSNLLRVRDEEKGRDVYVYSSSQGVAMQVVNDG